MFTLKFCEFGPQQSRNGLPVKHVAPCSLFFYVYFQFFPEVLKKIEVFFKLFLWEGMLPSDHKRNRTLFVWPIFSSEQLMTGEPGFLCSFFLLTNFQAFLPSPVVSLVYGFILSQSFPPQRVVFCTLARAGVFWPIPPSQRETTRRSCRVVHGNDR